MNYRRENLNNTIIPDDHYNYESPVVLKDFGVTDSAKVEVCFRDIEARLVNKINQYKCVVGCVAWLTNERILKALAKLNQVSIIVQKEGFLRPDTNPKPGWDNKLRRLYSNLSSIYRPTMPGMVQDLSTGSSEEGCDSIRCAGIYNENRKAASPRMHHKFLVFCESKSPILDEFGYSSNDWNYAPKEVWTGSFNLTENGINSLENIVIISSEEIAWAYYHEWTQVLAISEPLDWTEPYVEPEWRLGS
jgi:hypothetical protein